MVVRLFYKVPYYLIRIWWLGTRKNFDLEKNYAFIKKVTKAANRAGRVTIESYGVENIPKENGFIFFPNLGLALGNPLKYAKICYSNNN